MLKAGTRGANPAERGAVSAIVAVMFGTMVMFGLGALVLDIGSMRFERRQLQNGADAAVMALAQSCASDITTCSAANPRIQNMINANSNDGVSNTDGVCGVLPAAIGSSFGACRTANAADLQACPPRPSWLTADIPYVEVYAGTGSSATDQQPGIFSRALGLGDNPHESACARAAWGPPKSGSVLPITFSYCEFEDAMASGGYGHEIALAAKYKVTGSTTTSPCPDLGHTGMDAPGGFGWLDQTACSANVDVNGWVNVDTGKSGPTSCVNPGDTIFIPIYDCVSKLKSLCDNVAGGANTYYHVDGLAAFYVTGIVAPSVSNFVPGYPTSAASAECSDEANDKKTCVFGWFLGDYVAASGEIDPAGEDYGAKVAVPAG